LSHAGCLLAAWVDRWSWCTVRHASCMLVLPCVMHACLARAPSRWRAVICCRLRRAVCAFSSVESVARFARLSRPTSWRAVQHGARLTGAHGRVNWHPGAGGLAAAAEAAEALPLGRPDSASRVHGLRWRDVGPSRPAPGHEIECRPLAEALHAGTASSLRREDLARFGLPALTSQSYIKVGDRYFKPLAGAESRPQSAHTSLDAREAAGTSSMPASMLAQPQAIGRLERAAILAEAADRLQVPAPSSRISGCNFQEGHAACH